MEINVLASSSAGNCYWLSDGTTDLLIEAGIRLVEIQKKLQFKVARMDGVLLSHCHKDHSLCINELIKKYGIDCYTGLQTIKELAIEGYRVHTVSHNKQFEIESFKIVPFDLPHVNTDGTVCANLGYLIYSVVTKEYLLFATDCMYIRHLFPPCAYYLIECNYTESIEQSVITAVEKRRFYSHMSLSTAVEFLKHQDLSSCKAIYAIHTSTNRCDPFEIIRVVSKNFNKEIIIAGV